VFHVVCKDYSKSMVGRFFRHSVDYYPRLSLLSFPIHIIMKRVLSTGDITAAGLQGAIMTVFEVDIKEAKQELIRR